MGCTRNSHGAVHNLDTAIFAVIRQRYASPRFQHSTRKKHLGKRFDRGSLAIHGTQDQANFHRSKVTCARHVQRLDRIDFTPC